MKQKHEQNLYHLNVNVSNAEETKKNVCEKYHIWNPAI